MTNANTFTLPGHLAPHDPAMPTMEEDLIEDWSEFMEMGVIVVDGGVEVG